MCDIVSVHKITYIFWQQICREIVDSNNRVRKKMHSLAQLMMQFCAMNVFNDTRGGTHHLYRRSKPARPYNARLVHTKMASLICDEKVLDVLSEDIVSDLFFTVAHYMYENQDKPWRVLGINNCWPDMACSRRIFPDPLEDPVRFVVHLCCSNLWNIAFCQEDAEIIMNSSLSGQIDY
jgi:hypothetical protein